MFIRQFSIRNFKNHKDTPSLDLFPVTVFVGPNSGGKSAICGGRGAGGGTPDPRTRSKARPVHPRCRAPAPLSPATVHSRYSAAGRRAIPGSISSPWVDFG